MKVLFFFVLGIIAIMIIPPITAFVLIAAAGYLLWQFILFCRAVKKGKI